MISTTDQNPKTKILILFKRRVTELNSPRTLSRVCWKQQDISIKMSVPDDNFYASKTLDLFAFLMESLYLQSQTVARSSSQLIRKFVENAQIAELFDTISDKLAENPILRFLVLATALSCVIPIVIFIAFGIISLIVTFVGFLFIEGTLLAIGGLCLFISLVSLVMVMSVLAMSVAFLYVLVIKLATLLKRFESTSIILRNIAPSLAESYNTESSELAALTHQD